MYTINFNILTIIVNIKIFVNINYIFVRRNATNKIVSKLAWQNVDVQNLFFVRRNALNKEYSYLAW